MCLESKGFSVTRSIRTLTWAPRESVQMWETYGVVVINVGATFD
jgi:hypothetical protein